MVYWKRFFSVTCYVSLLVIGGTWSLVVANPTNLDRIVAIVGSKIILWSELQSTKAAMLSEMRAMDIASGASSGVSSGANEPPSLRDADVLDQLIIQPVIDKKLEDLGFSVQASDVDSAIDTIMSQNNFRTRAQLIEAVAREGLPFDEYNKNLEKQIGRSRFLSAVVQPLVKISPEDIVQLHRRRSDNQAHVMEYNLRMIFRAKDTTTLQNMQALANTIKEPSDFPQVARKESEGPGREDGGAVGYVRTTDVLADIGRVLITLPPNQISDIIDTEKGYYLVQYLDRRPVTSELTPQVEQELRQLLTEEATARAFDQVIQELRRANNVRIML